MNYDEHDVGSRPLPGAAVPDGVELLSSKGSPGILTSTGALESSSPYRRHSRGHSGDGRLGSIDEDQSMRGEALEMVEPPSPLKTRRPSTGASAATSILRQLTTKISPVSRAAFRSTERPRGQEYATLEDGDNGHGTVDISSLEGMGWEMTDLSNPELPRLQLEDTECVSPAQTSRRPDFRSFVDTRTSGGYGMKNIGVQLKRDPTRLIRRGTGDSRDGTSEAIERSKTVKDFGRNLAQEKNMIVEVEEVFDLSTLEGGQPDNRASRGFESVSLRQSMLPQETKSYFFPEDPSVPNWKPWSMRSWYILSLMGLALGLAGFQEFLCQKSFQKARNKSGILEFNAVADISTWDFFAWKCKPNTA